MNLNRRSLLKAFAAMAAGLLVPAGLLAETEPERRVWALGAIPGKEPMPFKDDPIRLHADRVRPMGLVVKVDYDFLRREASYRIVTDVSGPDIGLVVTDETAHHFDLPSLRVGDVVAQNERGFLMPVGGVPC